MQHLATFAGGPGRLPAGLSHGRLFMKNTILITTRYTRFHFDPQLASRAAGAPPARGTRGVVGGTGHIVTRNRQDPFSEFNDIILL